MCPISSFSLWKLGYPPCCPTNQAPASSWAGTHSAKQKRSVSTKLWAVSLETTRWVLGGRTQHFGEIYGWKLETRPSKYDFILGFSGKAYGLNVLIEFQLHFFWCKLLNLPGFPTKTHLFTVGPLLAQVSSKWSSALLAQRLSHLGGGGFHPGINWLFLLLKPLKSLRIVSPTNSARPSKGQKVIFRWRVFIKPTHSLQSTWLPSGNNTYNIILLLYIHISCICVHKFPIEN